MKIRIYSKRTQYMLDATICAAAWVAAFSIHYGELLPSSAGRGMLILLLPVACGQVVFSGLLGVYKFQWRYVNTNDALFIARTYAIFWATLFVVSIVLGPHFPLLSIPASILLNASILAIVGAVSARLARRLLYQKSSATAANGGAQRFVVVGAGTQGATVVREMLLRKGIKVVGFLDDDPEKQGAIIAGVPVIGRIADLPRVVQSRGVDEVLVCISPKARQKLEISGVTSLSGMTVRSRVIPTLDEILESNTVAPILPGVNEPPGTDAHAKAGVSKQSEENNGYNGHKPPRAHDITFTTEEPIRRQTDTDRKIAARTSPRTAAVVPNSPKNQTILITGGAGFIGSSLAEKLVDDNRVILLDQSFTGTPIQYTTLLRHPNVSAVVGNILDVDLRSLVQQADVVVHAAAILGVNRVCNSGRETLETNYVGTSRLLKALDARPEIQRFVYFSTSEVFGVNSYRVDEASRPNVGPIAESRWSYAMSKLAGEHLVASYFRETHLPIAIVRPFNIFGPRRTGDYALRRFVMSALQGEPLVIHGDGTQIRSWCYIDDFCDALVQMIVRPEAIGEDFNIGHPGNTLTVYELAQKVVEFTGSSSPIVFCESPFPDISIRVPSLSKAQRLLGYKPRYDLNTALKLTIQWYRESLATLQTPPKTQPEAIEPQLAA